MNGIESIKQTALELRKENIKGANFIVLKALSGLIKNIPKFRDKDVVKNIRTSCVLFFQTQPTMAPLANSMALVLNESEHSSKSFNKPEQFRQHITEKVEEIKTNYENSLKKIIENTSPIIQNNSRILTYSFSTTVFETIKFQKNLGKELEIFITESRPNNEGVMGAQNLSKIFPTTLFIDAAMGYLLNEYSIDLILIGADSFTKNLLIHKIGTLPLAINAHEFGIPVFILTHSLKYYHGERFGYTVPLKEMPKHEVLNFESTNLEIKNYYFDRTPMKYLSGIITEEKYYDLTKAPYTPVKQFPWAQLEKLYKTFQ